MLPFSVVFMVAFLPMHTQALQSGTLPDGNGSATYRPIAADKASPFAQPSSTKLPSKFRNRREGTAHHLQTRAIDTQSAAPPTAAPQVLPPAEQPAAPATIQYKQGILSIHAENSSLVDILNQVSRQTGLALEGLSHDKRIYGQYGPGNVTSTLTSLLNASGYNYIIIGGSGNHDAGKIILSANNPSGVVTATAANPSATPGNSTSEPAIADPSAPVHAKTPQEIFDELRKMHPQ